MADADSKSTEQQVYSSNEFLKEKELGTVCLVDGRKFTVAEGYREKRCLGHLTLSDYGPEKIELVDFSRKQSLVKVGENEYESDPEITIFNRRLIHQDNPNYHRLWDQLPANFPKLF